MFRKKWLLEFIFELVDYGMMKSFTVYKKVKKLGIPPKCTSCGTEIVNLTSVKTPEHFSDEGVLISEPKYSFRMITEEGYNLTIHHKIPKSRGGSNDKENLTFLCDACHRVQHEKEQIEFYGGLWIF